MLARSAGQFELKEGACTCRCIGWNDRSCWSRTGPEAEGRRRKYYKLTTAGRKRAARGGMSGGRLRRR
ncbi:MAG: hypothetical protein U0992_17475 [Planctomycetaceae bacterium]